MKYQDIDQAEEEEKKEDDFNDDEEEEDEDVFLAGKPPITMEDFFMQWANLENRS